MHTSALRPVRLAALAVLSLLLLRGDARAGLVPDFIDGQHLGVTETVNSGEIMLADLALERAHAAPVKVLAAELLFHHLAAQAFQDALADELDLIPLPSLVSLGLEAQVAVTFQLLGNLPASLFDRAYVDAQIALHTQVLVLLDLILIPTAIEDDVRDYLRGLRVVIADHLEDARDVRAILD